MTNKEALKTLKKFQKFRTGHSENHPGPTAVSEALNVAISLLESELNYCQCKVPHINPKWGGYECMKCDKTIK